MVDARFSSCSPITLRVDLGIDWLKHLNPFIDWVKYEVTFPSGFVVAAVPVTTSPQVELSTLKELLHTLQAKKHAVSWYTLVK